jgi:chromosome segregation ATPase
LLDQIAVNKQQENEIKEFSKKESDLQRKVDKTKSELKAQEQLITDLNSKLFSLGASNHSSSHRKPLETETHDPQESNNLYILQKIYEGLEDIMDKKHYLQQEFVSVKDYIQGTIDETVETMNMMVKIQVSTLIKNHHNINSRNKSDLADAMHRIRELEEALSKQSSVSKPSFSENNDPVSVRMLGNELETSRKQVEVLKSQVSLLEKAKEKFIHDLQEKEKAISQLKQQFSLDIIKKEQAIQEAYQKVAIQIEENNKNSELYNQQLKSLELNSRLIGEDLKKLIKENEQLTDDLASKENQLSEKENELNKLGEIVSSLAINKGQLTSIGNFGQISGINSNKDLKSYDELKAENLDLYGTSKELIAQIGSLQERFLSLKDNYLKIESENTDLKYQIQGMGEASKELQFDLVQRRALDEERIRVLKNLMRNEKIFSSEILSLEQKVSIKEKDCIEIGSLLKEKESNWVERESALEKEIKTLQDSLSSEIQQKLPTKVVDKKDEVTELKEYISEYLSKISQLESELHESQSKISTLRSENQKIERNLTAALTEKDRALKDLEAKQTQDSLQKPLKQAPDRPDFDQGEEEQDFGPGARIETSQGDEGDEHVYDNDDMQNAYCWLIFGNLVLRYQNAARERRIDLMRLKWVKARSKLLKYKSMQSENVKINDELKLASQREMAARQKKAELEEQLRIRENQIDELVNSRPSRHEQREEMKNSKSKIDKSKDDSKAVQLIQKFSSTLGMLQNFYTFDIPPMEDLYHRDWDTFVRKLKDQIRMERLERDNLVETVSQYKTQLNSKCLENEEMSQKLKGMRI